MRAACKPVCMPETAIAGVAPPLPRSHIATPTCHRHSRAKSGLIGSAINPNKEKK